MQAMLPTSTVDLNPIETASFIQKAVTSATWVWDTIWEKGSLAAHAIIFVFFRVLGLIVPGMVLFEALTCHTIALIQGIRSKSKENELVAEIDTLKIKNKDLTKTSGEMANTVIAWEGRLGRLTFERDRSAEERDIAQNKCERAVLGRAEIITDRDQFKTQTENLLRTVAERDRDVNIAKQTVNTLQTENLRQEHTINNLNTGIQQTKKEIQLATQLEVVTNLYNQLKVDVNSKELLKMQLSKLLPLYLNHKQAYRDMIQTRINSYGERSSPDCVPLKGLMDLSESESRQHTIITELLVLLKDI